MDEENKKFLYDNSYIDNLAKFGRDWNKKGFRGATGDFLEGSEFFDINRLDNSGTKEKSKPNSGDVVTTTTTKSDKGENKKVRRQDYQGFTQTNETFTPTIVQEQANAQADEQAYMQEMQQAKNEEAIAAEEGMLKEMEAINPNVIGSEMNSYNQGAKADAYQNQIEANQKDYISPINEDGTVNRDKIDSVWSRKEMETDEEIVNDVPSARKSIKMLEEELKTLENSPEKRKEKYLEFLRENGALKEWRPDLFKGLAGSAFRLLMGDSAGDAFTYSFGRLQEKEDAAQVAADKAELERIKNADTDSGYKFGQESKWVNLVDKSGNVSRVKTTVTEKGVPIINHNGTVYTYDQIEKRGLQIKDYHTETEISKAFGDHVKELSGRIQSIGRSDAWASDDSQKSFMSELTASTQVGRALQALERQGVDIGPEMDPDYFVVLESAASDYLAYMQNPPKDGGNKQYISFINDRLVRKDLLEAGVIDTNETVGPEFKKKWDNKLVNPDGSRGRLVDTGDKKKDRFVLNQDASAKLKKDAFKFTQSLSEEIRNSGNVNISRDQIRVSFSAYTLWLANKDAETIGKQAQAAYEAGLTPFMWWLRRETDDL